MSVHMTPRLVIRNRAYSDELRKAASSIEQASWSNLGYLNYPRPHYELYQEILDKYADYQLCLVDEETDYPVAVFNSVPLSYTGSGDLPQEGWDWVVETGARPKGPHNILGGLAMSIPAVHRAKGYGRRMLRAMRELAESKSLRGVFAAVRPSSKARHPWVGIDDYVTWTDGRGRAFDPWLRSHLSRAGAPWWSKSRLDSGRLGPKPSMPIRARMSLMARSFPSTSTLSGALDAMKNPIYG